MNRSLVAVIGAIISAPVIALSPPAQAGACDNDDRDTQQNITVCRNCIAAHAADMNTACFGAGSSGPQIAQNTPPTEPDPWGDYAPGWRHGPIPYTPNPGPPPAPPNKVG